MYTAAYQKTRSKPGMMTPGISPDTLDGMSSERMRSMISQLQSEKFQFTPGRRMEIDKANGGKRPLTIGKPTDKLVQEVIRMVTEAIYEPNFSTNSHGFRPNRSCHTATRQMFVKCKGTTWWMEGDIKACFDSMPHDKLMSLLANKIKDQRFLQTMQKALNAGYMYSNQLKYNIVGTPQGSIMSPMLANIYLDQTDKYVESIKSNFDQKTKQWSRTTEWRREQARTQRAKKAGADSSTTRKLSKTTRSTPSVKRTSDIRNIEYIRYADDWVVAVNGSYEETINMLNQITSFCNDMGLTVSPTKTKVTNMHKDHVTFLGTNIKYNTHTTYSTRKGGHKQRNSGFLVLSAPMDRMYKKLIATGFMKNYRGVSRMTWLPLSMRQMMHMGNSMISGYLNYYSFAHNRGNLASVIHYMIRDTMARTLAHKLSTKRRAKVYKKYGMDTKLYDQENRDMTGKPKTMCQLKRPLYTKDVWDFKVNEVNHNVVNLYANNVSLANTDDLSCKVCASKHKVEMHHIRQMKDINKKISKYTLEYLMMKANRKQMALCRECHMKHHSGKTVIPKDLMDNVNNKDK
uniref:COB-ai2 protein n=1 Tax=Yarrowia galli TaxID=197054 RepID=G4U520_9ASCO|nr:COB-ai2 protein [Yarrowia galli]CCC29072.1 COB-ai2 protein [Yarrowia galli]